MWQEDIQSNLASIAVTRRIVDTHMGGEADQLHATDFLVYALLQMGDDRSARPWVEGVSKIVEAIPDSNRRKGLIWTKAHFPALFALEKHHWADAASLPPVPDASPRVMTETYWARTIGTARKGDAEGARKNAERYEGQGEVDLPAREMLADMLLELNRPQEALAEYERSMKTDPNRFNALYSAGRAAELAQQWEKAKIYYATLLKNCEGSNSDRPELALARAAVERQDTAAK